jgi:maltose alpha-D-glucosyltransferase/alpha-amylase
MATSGSGWKCLPAGGGSPYFLIPARPIELAMNLPSLLDDLRGSGTEELARYLVRQRWFRSKARRLTELTLPDVALVSEDPPTVLALVQCHYKNSRGDEMLRPQVDQLDDEPEEDRETYLLPLVLLGDEPRDGAPTEPIVSLSQLGDGRVLDAAHDDRTMLLMAEGIQDRRAWKGMTGSFHCRPTTLASSLLASLPRNATPIRGEQSNTSYLLDHRLILKLIRKLEVGTNPEVEMLQFLTDRTGFVHAPRLVGHIEYCRQDFASTVAVLQEFVPNEGDGWRYTLDGLKALIGGISSAQLSNEAARALVSERAADFLHTLEQLGTITAKLHLALATEPNTDAFRPELIGPADIASWRASMEARIDSVFGLLRTHPDPTHLGLSVYSYDALERACRERIAALSLLTKSPMKKIRQHGDYHLGQVLRVRPEAGDFVVVDFEGEPARTLTERRAKACVLKDLAGMLRSFSYAREALTVDSPPLSSEQRAALTAWEELAGEVFLKGYERTISGNGLPTSLLPPKQLFGPLLDAFQADKAVYELGYELNNRPAWSGIPVRALQRLCGCSGGS